MKYLIENLDGNFRKCENYSLNNGCVEECLDCEVQKSCLEFKIEDLQKRTKNY